MTDQSGAHVYRMPAERVRAQTIAVTMIGAILLAILLLVFALIVLTSVRPRLGDSSALLVSLGLLAVGTTALLVVTVALRREARRVMITTSPEGIDYQGRGVHIRATWENCSRIGTVPIGLGFGDGIVLREPGMVRARLRDLMRAQQLDRVIPLSSVIWWWRDTELADDLARWAPHLGVAGRGRTSGA